MHQGVTGVDQGHLGAPHHDAVAVGHEVRQALPELHERRAFLREAEPRIVSKLNVIRQRGNDAVHQLKEVDPRTAAFVLEELHHVLLWAAFRHSTAAASLDMFAGYGARGDAFAAAARRIAGSPDTGR